MSVIAITREDADNLSMSYNPPGTGDDQTLFVIRAGRGTVHVTVVEVRYATLVNNAIMNDNTCGSVGKVGVGNAEIHAAFTS